MSRVPIRRPGGAAIGGSVCAGANRRSLKDIVELADRYGHRVRIAVRDEIAADVAIVSQVRRGGHDLIVMGVARRVGESLYFGDTAASVFEKASASMLLVST